MGKKISYLEQAFELDTIDNWLADRRYVKGRVYVGRLNKGTLEVQKIAVMRPTEGDQPSHFINAVLAVTGELAWHVRIYRDSDPRVCYVRCQDTWYRLYQNNNIVEEFSTARKSVIISGEGHYYSQSYADDQSDART